MESGQASAEKAVDGLVAGPPPLDLTAAAFFDVDNTLVQGPRWCISPGPGRA